MNRDQELAARKVISNICRKVLKANNVQVSRKYSDKRVEKSSTCIHGRQMKFMLDTRIDEQKHNDVTAQMSDALKANGYKLKAVAINNDKELRMRRRFGYPAIQIQKI